MHITRHYALTPPTATAPWAHGSMGRRRKQSIAKAATMSRIRSGKRRAASPPPQARIVPPACAVTPRTSAAVDLQAASRSHSASRKRLKEATECLRRAVQADSTPTAVEPPSAYSHRRGPGVAVPSVSVYPASSVVPSRSVPPIPAHQAATSASVWLTRASPTQFTLAEAHLRSRAVEALASRGFADLRQHLPDIEPDGVNLVRGSPSVSTRRVTLANDRLVDAVISVARCSQTSCSYREPMVLVSCTSNRTGTSLRIGLQCPRCETNVPFEVECKTVRGHNGRGRNPDLLRLHRLASSISIGMTYTRELTTASALSTTPAHTCGGVRHTGAV